MDLILRIITMKEIIFCLLFITLDVTNAFFIQLIKGMNDERLE